MEETESLEATSSGGAGGGLFPTKYNPFVPFTSVTSRQATPAPPAFVGSLMDILAGVCPPP